MSQLALYLLGPSRLVRDGEPVHIGRRKALALLAYLALEPGRHSRDALATLLYPDYDQRGARAELRRILSLLTRILGEGWLTAGRDTAGLDDHAGLWLDVDQFRGRLTACAAHGHPLSQACPNCQARLTEALELYQGDFMAGFTLPDSLTFDEWQRTQSEGLRRELGAVLERLVGCHSAAGEHEAAIIHARRWLALDPLHEPAYRPLMQLYAQTGQHAAALRQYRECVRLLEQELDLPPSDETTALYERIRAERVFPADVVVAAPPHPSADMPLPAFLRPAQDTILDREEERPVFVARERELARLDGYLDAALADQGQVVFVTGGPGRGKTALIQEFAAKAMDAHPDLLVASGNCNAFSGAGDPYLPFREILGMLTGDVEARWAAGSITSDHAQRLWAAFPSMAETLLERGPELINTLLPGPALLSRATAAADEGPDWLGELRAWVKGDGAGQGDLEQSAIFEQLTNVSRALAQAHPLLLILDDLQWADAGSVSLLFHLGRQLADAGGRILIVGAYRPEEVALGRPSTGSGLGPSTSFAQQLRERHPLDKVLTEFKRRLGDVWVDLAHVETLEGRRFVDELLDAEPNQLGEAFRSAMFQRTAGHPLFTIELLWAMQERGDLVQDELGKWVERPALDWATLPPRVEGVVEERVARLEEHLRDILAVASVEGETFTAQVVAQVQGIPEREMLRALSGELGNRHRLVRAVEEEQVAGAGRFLSRFQFAHALFQSYLYNTLSVGERRLLHGEIGEVLEGLYASAGQTDEIAARLAHHYTAAGQGEKAVEYSLRAGDNARIALAHEEAVDHYRQALTFLKEGGEADQERSARTLMKLGVTHHNAFQYQRARQAYDEGFVLWQKAADTRRRVAASPPPPPHALRLPWGTLGTLDPSTAWEQHSAFVTSLLFSGLVELSPESEVVPDLAVSWEILEDGRKYVFHLRDDVRWSDGVAVTAGDFEYAWKRALVLTAGLWFGAILHDIKGAKPFQQMEVGDEDVGVRAVDDVTLVVELEGPTSYFLQLLANNRTFAAPRHVVEAHGEGWADADKVVTNGPFRLETWDPGERFVLARNPDYHGRFVGNVERIDLFLLQETPSAIIKMYEADGLDAVQSIVCPVMDLPRQRHAGEFVSAPSPGTWGIGFDASRPPFDDARVRRAFGLVIDRERVMAVEKGYYLPATGGWLPPDIPGHSPGIGLPYDPERARELLARAGYPGGRGFPPVKWPQFAGHGLERDYLQTQWREELGIEVPYEIVDWRLVGRGFSEPPHIFNVSRFVDIPDPGVFVWRLLHLPPLGWRNETYIGLLEKARHITDHNERLRLYAQADRILVEEVPFVPLGYWRSHLLVKPWIKCPPSALGYGHWRDVKEIIIEPH